MVSTDYDERSISSITLALFEDSGWYKLTLIIQEVCLDLEKMKVVLFLVIYVL